MSDTEVSIGDLLDTLAALDLAQRRELAAAYVPMAVAFADEDIWVAGGKENPW
jgi:hypothetical protein